MQLDPATFEAHEKYINHAARCALCYPPTNRYCSEGKQLQIDYHAHHLMAHDLHYRRAALARVNLTDPDQCEALKAQMIVIHDRGKTEDETLAESL